MKTTHIPGQKRPEMDEIRHIATLIAKKEESYTSLGRKYGVSDNNIRKWIKQCGIHAPKKHMPRVTSTCKCCKKQMEYMAHENRVYCSRDCYRNSFTTNK